MPEHVAPEHDGDLDGLLSRAKTFGRGRLMLNVVFDRAQVADVDGPRALAKRPRAFCAEVLQWKNSNMKNRTRSDRQGVFALSLIHI